MELEESTCLTSGSTTKPQSSRQYAKPQSSRQYGTGTKTDTSISGKEQSSGMSQHLYRQLIYKKKKQEYPMWKRQPPQ